MTAATFGEFAGQADQRLTAAVGCPPGQADPVVVAGELRRVIGRMARYLDDRAPGYVVGSLSTVDMPPWQRAAVDARTALRWAASSLPEGTQTAAGLEPRPWEVLAGSLAGAATAMMAGRDLLHTHLAFDGGGERVDRSVWAPVVVSPAVTRALTAQIARWSGQAGLIAAQVAVACPPGPRPSAGLAEGLQGAARWLWLAQAAVQPALAAEPVTADDRRLLGAIPAARSQRRAPPTGQEQAAALCQGITVSAERLRTAVLVTAERGRGHPGAPMPGGGAPPRPRSPARPPGICSVPWPASPPSCPSTPNTCTRRPTRCSRQPWSGGRPSANGWT